MPYEHCPTCRVTVHFVDAADRAGSCPRCGDALRAEPRTPLRGLDPRAVRVVLQKTGGRSRRPTAAA
jgi:transcription initiation factor IIE alpha subunit